MKDSLREMIAGANENNLFMQCDAPNAGAFRPLPEGFSARLCRQEELTLWKTMWAQGQYMEFIDHWYEMVYAPHGDAFFQRCLFAVDEKDRPVASTGIWHSYGKINTVMGFFVSPGYEGRGIGRGILTEAMKRAQFPVYVHTHPIAARAIGLYADFGFKLVTDPVIGYRKNNLEESWPYLKATLPEAVFAALQTTKGSPALLAAAQTSTFSEF